MPCRTLFPSFQMADLMRTAYPAPTMVKYSAVAFFTINLILLNLEVSAQHQKLTDSTVVSNTTATKEVLGRSDIVPCSPTQVHLAIGDSSTDMKITWSTASISVSLVRYGTTPDILDLKATGNATALLGIGLLPSIQYIHSVALKGLQPGTKYYYSVGSSECGSRTFDFITMAAGSDWSPCFIFFGDMGTENAVILPYLQKDIADNEVHAIVHGGDFAYDLSSVNSKTGNEFMMQIENIAAHVPYMTCPGNHEILGDFYEYKTRFIMPNYEKTQSMYYSWDMGPVHFISICTEYYFLPYPQILPELAAAQYFWLLHDLQEAHKNRDVRPWIIVYGHRPFYCSNDNSECGNTDSPVRIGINIFGELKFGLENVFKDYQVDAYLSGHEHSYERLWPTYDRTVNNGSSADPYLNPKALIQIIAGNAGNKEGSDTFPFPFDDPPTWSAFRSENNGYLRMKISNRTNLHLEYVSTSQNGNIIDRITVMK